jgi:RNA polymerase sigma factor (sigma-70 family)
MIDTRCELDRPKTDGELLEAFGREGEQDAFAELVRRHGGLIYSAAWRVLGDRHEAEDVCQVVLLKLARKADRLADVRCLAAWLHHASRQAALDALQARTRRQRRHRVRQERQGQYVGEEASREVEQRELAEVVDGEVGKLPVSLRTPLLLHHVEGLTQQQIAERLGCSVGTLSWRLHRAREVLRSRLDRRSIQLTEGVLAGLLAGGAVASASSAATLTAWASSGVLAAGAPAATGGVVLGAVKAWAGAVLGAGTRSAATVAAFCALTATVLIATGRTDQYGDPLPSGALQRLGTCRFQHGAYIEAIDWSPDGKYLASVGRHDHTLRVWDARSGKEIWSEKFGNMARSVVFSADGTRMAASSTDGTARVWSIPGFERVAKIKTRPSTCVAISADGEIVGTAHGGHRPSGGAVYEVATGERIATLERMKPSHKGDTTDNPYGIAIHPDGNLAVTVSHRKARFYDLPSGEVVAELPGGSHGKVAFRPDGKQLAYTTRTRGLIVVDVEAGQIIYNHGMLPSKRAECWHCVRYSPDGKYLAAGNLGGRVAVWKADSRETLMEPPVVIKASDKYIGGVAFNPSSDLLAVGSWAGDISLWAPSDGSPSKMHGDRAIPAECIAYSPDGAVIATGHAEGTVQLWNARSGKHLARLDGQRARVRLLRFSPDATRLASTHSGGVVAVWNVPEMSLDAVVGNDSEEIHEVTASDVQFLPGNDRVLIARHGYGLVQYARYEPRDLIEPIDLRSGKPDGQFPEPPKFGSLSPQYTQISPQGLLAAARLVTPRDGKPRHAKDLQSSPITVWEIPTGQVVATVKMHAQPVLTYGFSPDGRRLLLGDTREVHVHDLLMGKQRTIRSVTAHAVSFALDGRLLALAGQKPGVFDLGTGREVFRAGKVTGQPSAVALSPDGRRMALADAEASVVIWDVPKAPDEQPEPGADVSEGVLAGAIEALGSDDAAKAYEGVWTLARAGKAGLDAIDALLDPVAKAPRAKRQAVDRLPGILRRLGSDSFRVRTEANRDLQQLAGHSHPPTRRRVLAALGKRLEQTSDDQLAAYLRKALEFGSVPEMCMPANLRDMRALWAVEMVGDRRALSLLKTLAGGVEDAPLTRHAKAASTRLGMRLRTKETSARAYQAPSDSSAVAASRP